MAKTSPPPWPPLASWKIFAQQDLFYGPYNATPSCGEQVFSLITQCHFNIVVLKKKRLHQNKKCY